jgi:hypothetical protein
MSAHRAHGYKPGDTTKCPCCGLTVSVARIRENAAIANENGSTHPLELDEVYLWSDEWLTRSPKE